MRPGTAVPIDRVALAVGLIAGLSLATLAIAGPPQQQEEIAVASISELTVDGRLDEWPPEPELRLARGSNGAAFDGPGAAAARGGLEVELWLARDATGIALAARWRDDTWDVEEIGYEDASWEAPDGGQMDRMYFNDHLGVRLRWPDRFYSLWLAPRAEEPVQWELFRDGPPGPSDTIGEVRVAIAAARADGPGFTIEARVDWESLGGAPEPSEAIDLIVVVPDSDCPGSELEVKFSRCMKYLRWSGSIRLSE